VDVSSLIRRRLDEFRLDQRDLAEAAQVTESYISQLLTRKKAPPAPNRTDIYEKMDRFLRLPEGELARLAALERREQLRRQLGDDPAPLFQEVRALILRKCKRGTEGQMRMLFEKEPFGEIERLVTQRLLDVVKQVAKAELDNAYWLRMVAELAGRSFEEMRVIVLQFLDADIHDLSLEDCVSFLDPLIESWHFNLTAFTLEIALNPRVVPGHVKRFAFVEQDPDRTAGEEPGLQAFLEDRSLSGTATEDEIAFLRRLRFRDKHPTGLYYYRELQNLRDPLHFSSS
jgi:transcriptional regulator with XRE-family HTH domain